jgi:hypothetical protein
MAGNDNDGAMGGGHFGHRTTNPSILQRRISNQTRKALHSILNSCATKSALGVHPPRVLAEWRRQCSRFDSNHVRVVSWSMGRAKTPASPDLGFFVRFDVFSSNFCEIAPDLNGFKPKTREFLQKQARFCRNPS